MEFYKYVLYSTENLTFPIKFIWLYHAAVDGFLIGLQTVRV